MDSGELSSAFKDALRKGVQSFWDEFYERFGKFQNVGPWSSEEVLIRVKELLFREIMIAISILPVTPHNVDVAVLPVQTSHYAHFKVLITTEDFESDPIAHSYTVTFPAMRLPAGSQRN